MIKVLAGLVSSEASPLGLQMAVFLQCPHMAFSLCVYIPHVSLCVQISSSYKDTSQIGLGTFQQTYFNLITSLRPYLQIQSSFEVLGIRSFTFEFGRDKFSL